MSRGKWASVLVPVAAAALVLSACSGGGNGAGGLQTSDQLATGKNDINPHPASDIKDGGTLQWPLDALPDNWNENQSDGATLSGFYVVNALMPYFFKAKADNSLELDTNYLTSAEVVSTDPLVIDYKINPKAKWNNGRPITWEDVQAQATALNGKNTAYLVSTTTGYENIAKVEKGADDKEAKVTFATPFGEWKSLFSPLYPKELNSDAETFNKGWAENAPITASAFKVGKVDLTGKTVTEVRDPNWWGTPAHLDSIVFKVVSRPTLADALSSGAVDFYRVGSSVDLFKRGQAIPNTKMRQALEASYNLLDFSGAPSSILHDQDLRVAIEQGVDTKSIATGMLGPILPNPTALGNHFFMQGTKDYKDNSAPVKFDVEASKKKLDELGWKQNGQFRAKDGKELAITMVIDAANPISTSLSNLVQQQLKTIGVNTKINSVPAAELFKNYVVPGAFDLAFYNQNLQPQPVSTSKSAYYLDANSTQQNYAHIGNEAINKLLDAAAKEVDDTKRADLVQQADTEIWKSGHILPIYQVPGAYVVKNTLANFGAPGFAQYPIDYASIGFLK
ncbi:ABC transporter family substrate-binding protein [Kutzneria albida]|uniref:Solute-binding protein family 5 domain-containing protein n=1 Tax=Kutzneria albida DSM 43870 TaxID=1449976 RepID=W5W114_9PSEU|nr:ABC transporter family substrate-binding protein [Kutzneria albida]AHH94485.1 hypothetical protein KALB_1112 [Kutzneria albida DSM 43870]